MPVVARLSKRFYDELGEDIANELVELLNQVDVSSRNELRELNEANFARSDAKLEQRSAELNAKIDRVTAELNAKIDRFATGLDAKIDRVATELNAKIDGVEVRLGARIDAVAAVMVTKSDLADKLTAQSRFLYLAMAMQFAATVGLWLR
jgi:uncharacterized small protein (DUF1192 family)